MGKLHNFWRAYSSFVAQGASFALKQTKGANDAASALMYHASKMTVECFQIQ